MSEDGAWTSCRGQGRNSFCVQYDLDITADMSGDTIRSAVQLRIKTYHLMKMR